MLVMKKFISVMLCLALLSVFPQFVFADTLRINQYNIINVSMKTSRNSMQLDGESSNYKHISYVRQLLTSLDLTPDTTDLSNIIVRSSYELTLKYSDETEESFTLYNDKYLHARDTQYILDLQKAKEFILIGGILNGNILLPQTPLPDLKLYINDKLQQGPIYKSWAQHLPESTRDHLPLCASLEALGCTVTWQEPNVILVETPSERNVYMRLNEDTISYQYYFEKDYPSLDEPVRSTRVDMEYVEVDGVVYYPIYEFSQIANCEIYRDGNNIYLDSLDYYKNNHTIYNNIGRRINVNAYINDIKIDTPVFCNKTALLYDDSIVYSFVLLRPVFEALDAEIEFVEPNTINVTHDNEVYTFYAGTVVNNGEETVFDEEDYNCYIVDGKTYISFTRIRKVIGGWVKENDASNMSLYTKDVERFDIPMTLEDAYTYFDETLSPEDIDFIKNCTEKEFYSMHFGLGLWIRNNWIYAYSNRIEKVFLDNGIEHPDDISSYIIRGYKLYLNDMPAGIDDLV